MDNPRPEKVAVVDEVRERFSTSDAALLTEYRGIDVGAMQDLRRALRAAGGDYKIYKNTLVRFAARDLGLEIDELLTGPTAIAFVPTDGGGDPVTVAKALRDFAKSNPGLVVKGGLLGTTVLSTAETSALAEVAPREELLAELAGLMAAPMQRFAGLLQALPQNLAGLLQALIDQGGAPGAPASAPAADAAETAEPAADVEPVTEDPEPAAEAAEPVAEATEAEAPATDTTEPAAPAEPGDDTATEES